MTAQIISLDEFRDRKRVAALTALAVSDFAAALRHPVRLPADAPLAATAGDGLAKPGEATIVLATALLSAACRDMAANLAMLMAHAEAACHSINDIGNTAEALVKTGAELRQVANSFRQDHAWVASEFFTADPAGRTL